MVELNLLPWRDYVRKKQWKKLRIFYSFFFGILFSILLCLHAYLSHFIYRQTKYYEARLAQVGRVRVTNASEKHNEQINENIKHQNILVGIFNQFIDMHKKVSIIEFATRDKKISIKGVALSLVDVRQIMSNLLIVKNIDYVTLGSLSATDHGMQFEILVMER